MQRASMAKRKKAAPKPARSKPVAPRKLQGYLAGDAKARALLSRNGVDPGLPEHQRFLRIARAYFAFDETGADALRDQMLAQCLREMAKRENAADAQDRGRARQRRERRDAMFSRAWLGEFVRVAQATGSKTAAARTVQAKYKPLDAKGLALNTAAIREQARRAQVLPPSRRKK